MVGLFGGTFNPIHYGHLRAAEELRSIFNLSKVVFIPAKNPPLKRDAIAPSRHRFEMVRLAIAGNPGFVLSDIECRSEEASYTVHTIQKMKSHYSECGLYFIMGLDAFLEMPKWFKADEILANAALIVMARPTVEMEKIKESPYIDTINHSQPDVKMSQLRLKNGKYLSVARITPQDISSTKIRQAVREGGSIKYLLPECVEKYIINNKLYR